MDTDALNPELAVKGLAVMTAIPIVALALWSDYFGRHLQTLSEETPDYDPTEQLFKVRLASLSTLIFQFMVFLGTADVRKIYPVTANLLFVAALALQMWIQSNAEKKIRPNRAARTASQLQEEAQKPQVLGFATRAFLWSAIGGAFYIGILIFSLKAFFAVSQLTHASPAVSMALMVLGSIVGVVGGLGLGFALGPFQVRKMFPTSPVTDEGLRTALDSCFSKAGIPAPSYWILELDQFQTGNAMIAGFKSGKGIFRPALFISRSLTAKLSESELRAVVLHELSHLKLRHLQKRFLLSAGMILAASFAAGFLVVLAQLLFPGNALNSMIGLGTVLASFFLTFKYLEKQNRLQEIEADITAVKLGVAIDDLAGALRKIDGMNNQPSDEKSRASQLSGSGHPATEERIKIIQAYFEKYPLPASSEEAAPEVDRAA